MKQFKLFFACALLTLFSVSMWATEQSVTISPSQALNDGGVDPITIACAKGDGTSNPAISSSQLRLYQAAKGKTTGNTITFSSTYSITKIEFTFANSMTADNGSFSDGTYDSENFTWTGSANSLTLTVTGTTSGTRIYITNMVVYYETGGGTPTCATPTFSPAAGSYEGTQNVTITSTTGATIYYTTDGSTPTTTSSVYSTAIPVAADMTIKAYAVKSEYNDSEVAEAAYTITEGPDVVLDLTDNAEWGFPAGSGNKTVDEGSYSDGTYTIKVAGSTGQGYYHNTGYLLLGKTGAYIELPEFASPIEKIITVGTSGGSEGVTFNVFDGSTAVSTEATGCKNVDQTFNIENPEANKVYTIKVTGNANLQVAKIKIYFGAAAAVAKPTISGDENFVTSTTVTLACSTTGADIYYTTDGSDPKSGTIGTSFSLTETATVRAIAKLGSDWSAEATKTFTKVTPMTTAAALRSFATSSAQNAFIQLDGWKVTFVSGNNAYIIDPSNEGVILNNASHGYVAGDELNDEVVEASVKLASGRVQLSGFTSTDITATSGTVSPVDVTDFSTVLAANQSRLITLKNATYASSTGTFSDGEHLIYFYDQFSASPTLVDAATYDVTGVVIYYKNNTTDKVQVAPRTAADVVPTSVIVIPTAANLAALKAAARGTYILTLTNAVVTYVNGNNAFIEDATGGALIYLASHGFTAGDCLNGDYQVTTTDHQGKFEITAIEPQAGAATTTAEIPLTTISIATLNANFGSYESMRVKIAGANVTGAISGSDRNGEINDGAAVAVYAAAGASIITLTADDNVDIIGYPGYYNTNQQFNVWQQSDITVNVKDPAGIAFTPESETITGGDPWLAPTFANPNSLDVEFSSDAEGVATVSNTGVVALAGGYGTAVITAHTDGDATHNAGNATYTITVNDPGATPVYTMSFDLTRASYDDAADAEVVWNSNVVTITAQKSSGTKVTNYLAGNYSGTTLIEETRLYENNNLVFTPQTGVTITKVEWTATSSGYAESLADYSAWTNATASVDGSKVVITPSATGEYSVVLGKKTSSTKGTRGTSVAVFYTAESEKAKLTASIAIDNMNMAVGDDDILLSAIAATSNPNKKAISYAVTSGTAVTIEGTGAEAALHAAAEGSATITATIPDDLGNYTGVTTTFTITVAAAATLESIAIDGTATELEYTEGQSFNPAGLTVMGHYSNGSDVEITSGIDWTFAPDPLTEGTTSVSVTATVETISSDAFVVNGLTVGAPAPVGDNYVKVTASQTDWSGDYILVYEDGTDAYVWNGDYSDGASNYASATISSNTIAKPAAAAVITIAAASEGKYTLQVNGDKYFQDNGSSSKLIFTDAIEDAAKVTISYETDWTKLLFSERCIRFNSSSGQTRFRFYGESNQQAIQLYKKEVVTPTPDYTRTEMLGAGVLGTICVDHNVTSAEGATFYEVSGLNGSQLVLAEVTGELEAGKPYVFQATGDVLNLYYGSTSVTEPDNSGALKGTFDATTIENTDPNWANIYYFANHALYSCSDLTSLTLPANRAYLVMSQVGSFSPMPGRRYFTVNVNGKTTPTDMEEITNDQSQMTNKVIIDGRLYILRGEKLYDATGRLVK